MEKGSSGNQLKMILGLREFLWLNRFLKIYLLWGSFWGSHERQENGPAQKMCPKKFNIFFIFEKFKDCALICGFGFGLYLKYYWSYGHLKNG